MLRGQAGRPHQAVGLRVAPHHIPVFRPFVEGKRVTLFAGHGVEGALVTKPGKLGVAF